MVANRTELHSGFRFHVKIDNMHNVYFTEFRLPSLQVEVEALKEGGQNAYIHQLPGRVNVGTATLRHGLTKDLELLKWYMQVLSGDVESAYRQVTVTMYDVEGKAIVTWNFRNAFPTKWSGPTLRAESSEVAIEEIEFVYHGFAIGNRPPSAGR